MMRKEITKAIRKVATAIQGDKSGGIDKALEEFAEAILFAAEQEAKLIVQIADEERDARIERSQKR
jgi:hypothetical protein